VDHAGAAGRRDAALLTPRARAAVVLPLVPVAGGVVLVLATTLPAETLRFFVPALASVAVFAVFATVLRWQVGGNVFGELGFLYVGLIVAYTVLPAAVFMLLGFDAAGPLALLLPEPSELRTHLWRHVLFQSGVAVGYLLWRGRRDATAPGAGDPTDRDGRTVLVVTVVIGVCVAAVASMSAPVESYYDHYVRYDHLGWLPRKLVSLAIRLSLGLYCVLLVFLFRNYRKYRLVIPFVIVAIAAYEMTYSYGARIQALIVLLLAVCLYHYSVREVSLKAGVIACVGLAALFSAVEVVRAAGGDFDLARDVIADDGLKPAGEFFAVFFSGFQLYAERAQGTLASREWPMLFYDFSSLVTFGAFTRWNPIYWYANNYYPDFEVPPFTLGPIAESAIWGGELDLVLRSVLNGLFFAWIMRWFIRHRARWWGLTVYAYCYATCILTLKYSVFFVLNPIVKNLVPTLLLVSAVRILTFSPGLRTAGGGGRGTGWDGPRAGTAATGPS